MRPCLFLLLSFLSFFFGCGLKASLPRPPLDEPAPVIAPSVTDVKDAGCCGGAK